MYINSDDFLYGDFLITFRPQSIDRHEETKFNFVDIDKLSEYTAIHVIPNNEDKILDAATITRLKNNIDNQHYLKLDKALLTLINNSWTRKQILAHLMTREPTAFFETIGKSNTIIGVTDVLS